LPACEFRCDSQIEMCVRNCICVGGTLSRGELDRSLTPNVIVLNADLELVIGGFTNFEFSSHKVIDPRSNYRATGSGSRPRRFARRNGRLPSLAHFTHFQIADWRASGADLPTSMAFQTRIGSSCYRAVSPVCTHIRRLMGLLIG
jgi:hypothetical protein